MRTCVIVIVQHIVTHKQHCNIANNAATYVQLRATRTKIKTA